MVREFSIACALVKQWCVLPMLQGSGVIFHCPQLSVVWQTFWRMNIHTQVYQSQTMNLISWLWFLAECTQVFKFFDLFFAHRVFGTKVSGLTAVMKCRRRKCIHLCTIYKSKPLLSWSKWLLRIESCIFSNISSWLLAVGTVRKKQHPRLVWFACYCFQNFPFHIGNSWLSLYETNLTACAAAADGHTLFEAGVKGEFVCASNILLFNAFIKIISMTACLLYIRVCLGTDCAVIVGHPINKHYLTYSMQARTDGQSESMSGSAGMFAVNVIYLLYTFFLPLGSFCLINSDIVDIPTKSYK